jgi:hypothetical protein
MGRLCTTQGRDEMHVPNRLGVLVTQAIQADFLCALHALFDSVFIPFEMLYFRPPVCGALHYSLLGPF